MRSFPSSFIWISVAKIRHDGADHEETGRFGHGAER